MTNKNLRGSSILLPQVMITIVRYLRERIIIQRHGGNQTRYVEAHPAYTARVNEPDSSAAAVGTLAPLSSSHSSLIPRRHKIFPDKKCIQSVRRRSLVSDRHACPLGVHSTFELWIVEVVVPYDRAWSKLYV